MRAASVKYLRPASFPTTFPTVDAYAWQDLFLANEKLAELSKTPTRSFASNRCRHHRETRLDHDPYFSCPSQVLRLSIEAHRARPTCWHGRVCGLRVHLAPRRAVPLGRLRYVWISSTSPMKKAWAAISRQWKFGMMWGMFAERES